MKVIAYIALHYGSDYLASAIRSVIDDVDELWVLYTPVGSHGTRTDTVCPDTRDTLYTIASAAATWKLHWVDGEWSYEGAHRDAIHALVPDADVVLVLDADEVWSTGLAAYAIREGTEHYPTVRRWRAPMVHYWRSFTRCIVHDPAYPIRMILPKVPENERVFYLDMHNPTFPDQQTQMLQMPIHHFGYAQRSEIVRYKLLTHGHISQFRTDVDWYRDIFAANRQTDTHPVGSEFWNPETVNPFLLGLPPWIQEHPYYGLDVIP